MNSAPPREERRHCYEAVIDSANGWSPIASPKGRCRKSTSLAWSRQDLVCCAGYEAAHDGTCLPSWNEPSHCARRRPDEIPTDGSESRCIWGTAVSAESGAGLNRGFTVWSAAQPPPCFGSSRRRTRSRSPCKNNCVSGLTTTTGRRGVLGSSAVGRRCVPSGQREASSVLHGRVIGKRRQGGAHRHCTICQRAIVQILLTKYASSA